MKTSQWNNQVFAFCGDLGGGAIITVEFDPDIFDETQDSEIRVAINAIMEEEKWKICEGSEQWNMTERKSEYRNNPQEGFSWDAQATICDKVSFD